MTTQDIFGDVAEILAKLNPTQVMKISAPEAVSKKVEILVLKKKKGIISSEESVELERLLALDLLITLAKVKAVKLARA